LNTLRVYLLRHGETEWSLSGRHTGRTDVPLSARGEDEARGLAPRLREIQFAHVLSSPLQRARRTCDLTGLGAAAAIEPDLAEWDYGDYEGQRSVDIRKQRADWNIFRDGCPHGESPAQISGRTDRLIAHLRALDGNVALFSHGQFGCVLAARWIGLPLAEAQHFTLGTASLSILGHDPHHLEVAVIALWNAASGEETDPMSFSPSGETKTVNPRALERWENEGGEIKLGADPALPQKSDG
jgi:probable phosphoglycerate mutase